MYPNLYPEFLQKALCAGLETAEMKPKNTPNHEAMGLVRPVIEVSERYLRDSFKSFPGTVTKV